MSSIRGVRIFGVVYSSFAFNVLFYEFEQDYVPFDGCILVELRAVASVIIDPQNGLV